MEEGGKVPNAQKPPKTKFAFLHELCAKNRWVLGHEEAQNEVAHWLCVLTLKESPFDGL